MNPTFRTTYVLLAALLLPATTVAQTLITLTASSVIGGSGAWGNNNWDDPASGYVATFVVDQQTGAISEPTPTGFWLGREGVMNEYFVLDLGAVYTLSQIDLFNTHNQLANDRSTNAFTIHASNSVTFVNASVDFDLVSGSQILASSLAFQSTGNDPIEAASYTSGNGLSTGTAYRYLKFTAVTNHGGLGVGLNEIRVFGTAIPEPSTYAALAGIGALVLALRRRRRGVA